MYFIAHGHHLVEGTALPSVLTYDSLSPLFLSGLLHTGYVSIRWGKPQCIVFLSTLPTYLLENITFATLKVKKSGNKISFSQALSLRSIYDIIFTPQIHTHLPSVLDIILCFMVYKGHSPTLCMILNYDYL